VGAEVKVLRHVAAAPPDRARAQAAWGEGSGSRQVGGHVKLCKAKQHGSPVWAALAAGATAPDARRSAARIAVPRRPPHTRARLLLLYALACWQGQLSTTLTTTLVRASRQADVRSSDSP
jgi:hypothetical protein